MSIHPPARVSASNAPAAAVFEMGAVNIDRATEAATAMPLPSPTLTNPEMILPFAGVDTSSSRSPSPEIMFPLLLPEPMAPSSVRHDSKQIQSPACVGKQQSSPRLSHSPGESSVNSDELEESITWLRFDDGLETGSDVEDDEERFGSFPQVADGDDNDRWDMPQLESADEDDFSSAALSRRADIILANAKKRLSLMEGNLRGARSSLVSPIGSFAGLRSPIYTHGRSISSDLGFSSQERYQPSQFSSLVHAGMTEQMAVPPPQGPLRASSAMAFTLSSVPGDRRFALRESRSQEQILLKRWKSVNEGGFFPSAPDSHGSSDLDLVPEDRPFTSGARRSPSTATDLREQMNDLKGRISKLQQRAREDCLKRRSLQSLQTLSPFTSAPDVWYSDQDTTEVGDFTTDGRDAKTQLPNEAELEMTSRAVDLDSQYEDAAEEPAATADYNFNDEEAIISGYETSDSISVYEDARAIPERHEDRADAFDYERFFLHSGMGTITNASRRSSVSSHDSVETTRPASPPPIIPADPGLHKRMPSIESISTQASFVTAEGGQDSDSENGLGNRLESAIGTTWPTTSFMHSSPTLGTADSSRRYQGSVSVPLEQDSSSPSMLSFVGVTQLDETDKALIKALEDGLRHVCEQLHAVKDNTYDRREWRRRLDAARKALQGEIS